MDMHTEILIDAPAAAAWRVLGQDFGAICQWSAAAQASSIEGALGIGAIRTCEAAGFGPFPPAKISEQLTRFDPKAMVFAYDATSGLPWFIDEASNTWSIEPMGYEKCRVHSNAVVKLIWWLQPLGFLLPFLVRKDLRRFSEELKHQIELGRPHPRKLAAMTVAARPAAAPLTTPHWFWPVAVIAFLWGLVGSGFYVFETYFSFTNPRALPSMIGEEGAVIVLARPPWAIAMYALAVFGGLFGGLLLLLRKRAAALALEASLIGVLGLQFYWWMVIDIGKDWGWPVGIVAFAILLFWFAHTAGVRGWIGKTPRFMLPHQEGKQK